MNCLEAQSKIMAFIENKLPDDELREFIKHVRSCKNCYEELDIYYTLIVGMKQLDESDNISTDFKNALDRHLDEEMNRLTTVKRIANSTIMVVIVLVVSGLIWLYSGVLDKVYNYEQTSKLSEQSEYYYQDFFGSRLLNDEEYDVSDIDKYYIEINTTQDETTDESKVKMISVMGMNIEDAKKALNDIGLGTRVTKEESDTYEVDQVISQDVEEGEEVDMYSTIALVVSSGSNGVAVPNVTGQEEAAAKSTLEAAGFKVNVTQSSSDSVQEGLVISQDPTADSKAENGATITLTVSTGPEIKRVKVPDLRGMTESAAKSKLAEYGLNCGTVSETYSDTVTEGCVVSQSYSPDSEVDEGTSVNIQLSVGPEKHTYKYVTTLNAPSGYTSGNVTVTITASDGTTRSFTTSC